jgi:hypothetical protein
MAVSLRSHLAVLLIVAQILCQQQLAHRSMIRLCRLILGLLLLDLRLCTTLLRREYAPTTTTTIGKAKVPRSSRQFFHGSLSISASVCSA